MYQQYPPPPFPTPPAPRPRRRVLPYALGGLAVLLIGAIAVGAALLTRPSAPVKAAAPSTSAASSSSDGVAAGMTNPALAAPTPTLANQAFVDAVRAAATSPAIVDSTDAALSDLGQAICTLLRNGTPEQEAYQLLPTYGGHDTGILLASATVEVCPDQQAAVQAWASSASG